MALAFSLQGSSDKHVRYAQSKVGIKETHPNRGPYIDSINRPFRNIGGPYCATFGADFLKNGGAKHPSRHSALAQNYWRYADKTRRHTIGDVLKGKYKPKRGDLVIWKRGNTVKGHLGVVLYDWKSISGWTVEGNTSSGAGSQYDGDGFHVRYRRIEPYNYFRIMGFVEVY